MEEETEETLESEWAKWERERDDMNKKFDKAYSLFPNSLSVSFYADDEYRKYSGGAVYHCSVSYVEKDTYKTIEIVGGYVQAVHVHVDNDIYTYEIKEAPRKLAEISDEDASELLITALRLLYKCDGTTGRGIKIAKYEKRSGYSITVPRIELHHHDSNNFNWFQG